MPLTELTCTLSGQTRDGAKYEVSTASSPTRGEGTGTWQILSAVGKGGGRERGQRDLAYLRNLYGGYLDTNGHATSNQKSSGGKFRRKAGTPSRRPA